MSTSDIHGPQYHPRSITVELRDDTWCVVDRSYVGAEHVVPYASYLDATKAGLRRKATIKGALTRRANKRNVARAQACTAAGVAWTWLRRELTEAEADAWLGLD